MKIYTFKAKQNLPISLEKVDFFLSNPQNLKTITPVLSIRHKWVTEITHLKKQTILWRRTTFCSLSIMVS